MRETVVYSPQKGLFAFGIAFIKIVYYHWIKTVIVILVRIYTCAYLHHLDKAREILGARLNTIHNLYFYQRLMADLREALEQGKLAQFVTEFYRLYKKEEPL